MLVYQMIFDSWHLGKKQIQIQFRSVALPLDRLYLMEHRWGFLWQSWSCTNSFFDTLYET